MNIAQGIESLSIGCIPMLLGIICHEVAHGYTAYMLGDPTAKYQGRLTLNPIVHIDVMGAIVFITSSLLTPFAIGWAKPVPIDIRYFSNIRKDILLVALAGPCANLILALLFALLLKGVIEYNDIIVSEHTTIFIYRMLHMGVFINVLLAVFNMLPIPPLDGSKVLAYYLPPHIAYRYESWERFGAILILVFVILGLGSLVLLPIVTSVVFVIFSALSLG